MGRFGTPSSVVGILVLGSCSEPLMNRGITLSLLTPEKQKFEKESREFNDVTT